MNKEMEKKKISLHELWDKVQQWVDGPDDSVVRVNNSARDLRQAERFLKTIAVELEESLLRESFAPPGLPLCAPQEFIIYLSQADDKEWLGNKRRALKQALNHALAERVRGLSNKKTDAPLPVVQLRVDGTLGEGQIRIQPCWEPAKKGTTLIVLPKDTEGTDQPGIVDPDITHVYLNDSLPDGDPTQVILPETPLYHVEVWHANIREALVPISQPMIKIGRGARTMPVDLRLKDPNISRMHATLERDPEGKYWLVSQGQNPISVNGHEVARNERIQVMPNARIGICSYSLEVK